MSAAATTAGRRVRLPNLDALSFRTISAVYVWLGLILLFAVWVPDTFLSESTVKSLLSQQAVTAILAIGLIVPLAAGVFDLSIGYTLGFAHVLCAWLMARHGFSAVEATLVALGAGFVIGAINGALVVFARISSFIATLGMSSVLAAMIVYVSDNEQIIGFASNFSEFGGAEVLGLSSAFLVMLALAVIVWYVLQKRPIGRFVYATGGNEQAARLSGVRTRLIIFSVLIVSGVIAALAGVVLASRIGVGSPSIGPPYLLPAFAAAFLGSTQLHRDRFNVWGTVIAVFVLATGVKGLQLAGAPFWLPDLFNGLALLIAVGLSVWERKARPTSTAATSTETSET